MDSLFLGQSPSSPGSCPPHSQTSSVQCRTGRRPVRQTCNGPSYTTMTEQTLGLYLLLHSRLIIACISGNMFQRMNWDSLKYAFGQYKCKGFCRPRFHQINNKIKNLTCCVEVDQSYSSEIAIGAFSPSPLSFSVSEDQWPLYINSTVGLINDLF